VLPRTEPIWAKVSRTVHFWSFPIQLARFWFTLLTFGSVRGNTTPSRKYIYTCIGNRVLESLPPPIESVMHPSSFDPNTSERRWTGSAVPDVSCAFWPAATSPSTPLYRDCYPDYNPRPSSYTWPSLSPTLSPCSSAGSTKSSSADYVWDGAGLYILDDAQHRHFSSSNPGDGDQDEMEHERHDARVKSEPVDTSFIIEAPAPSVGHCVQAPTTIACPSLRATHATKDMKKMMGVFRLDPFIFKGGAWQQEENTGLKEEPEYLQFYLDFDLENVFEQCMWSPQPEEHVDRAYREEAGARDQQHPPSYSNQPSTYTYEGEQRPINLCTRRLMLTIDQTLTTPRTELTIIMAPPTIITAPSIEVNASSTSSSTPPLTYRFGQIVFMVTIGCPYPLLDLSSCSLP
jgi:hypothetical protein